MVETKSFADIGLRTELQQACTQLQWKSPTAIQTLSIPPALEGRNLVALAETGSGKTGAYALPIVQKLLDNPCHYFALVLAPTRELAAQVQAQFSALGKAVGLRAILLVGGVPITQQADQMRLAPPHVLIATPGRLVDHLKKTKGFDEIKFANLHFLVIDEADRMLGSDFDTVLEKVLCMLPRKRQTFLFSATMTDKVGKLQRASVRDPVFVSTRKSKFQMVANLRQFVLLVPQAELDSYLVYLLRVALCPEMEALGLEVIRLESNVTEPEEDKPKSVMPTSVIVFTRTRVASNRLSLLLRQFIRQPVIALNGDMPQAQRLGALYKFKQTNGAVLVATDVASRGLDIPQVGLVVNYDVPLDAKTYMHRVGRTARAGRMGCALTLLTQYSVVFFLKEIESHLISALGNQSQKVPSLIETGSAADQALEAAVGELDAQVKEAGAQANQAMNALQKRTKQGKHVSAGDLRTPCTNDLPTKPGLKRTAWASEAPLAKRNEILEVMKSVSVEQRSTGDLETELVSEFLATQGESKKRDKRSGKRPKKVVRDARLASGGKRTKIKVHRKGRKT
ncbi:ribosomal RNA processing protein [Clonorchis sinensis]|uniref:RNA helicase n=1 Tax=Clonorchis sinensis TaxID=79923 RepID=A0A8T1MA61_CLOSI|nr:ribosomal RNA processing protein [Clonorchis sinensis]